MGSLTWLGLGLGVGFGLELWGFLGLGLGLGFGFGFGLELVGLGLDGARRDQGGGEESPEGRGGWCGVGQRRRGAGGDGDDHLVLA